MTEIKHTEAFDLAYRFVTETNLNIFLTGKAGTGKTTFLKYLREHCYKKMVVAAPTGVAAINAGGVTLHSLFQLPFGPFIPSSGGTSPPGKNEKYPDGNGEALTKHSLLSRIRYHSEKLNLFRNLELLIIDEASMVACYTVDSVDTILRSIRRRHDEPFGGVQVLFIGDLHQLQPVVKNEEWQFLKDYYSSIFFFDSLVLKENPPVMIELKEIFRQKEGAFVEVLNDIRNNTLSRENFDLLNTRLQRGFVSKGDEGYITLTTHNSQADRINQGRLQTVKATPKTFIAEIEGDFAEHLYPAERELILKEGAQVMFLKNDLEEKKYFNGKIGIVTRLSDDSIRVQCKGEAEEITVKKQEWKNVNYKLNHDTREISEQELGSFIQYPLRLAWAITIHKSQGLTFDKVVIDAENAFANGQVYVALSRCTTLDGLILTSPINRQFLGAHENLTEWQQKNYDENSLPERFTESRRSYLLRELQSIFTWKEWYFGIRELKKVIEELKGELPAECISWIGKLSDHQKAIYDVSEKFKERMNQLYAQNPEAEENEPLQKRIKDAAAYFSNEIEKWKTEFRNHSLSTDKRKNSKKLDEALDDLNVAVYEILNKINHCKNGFILDDYLKKGKKISAAIPKIQGSYAQGSAKMTAEPGSSHAELFDRLADMRKRIADETGVPLYMIFSKQAIQGVCENLPGNKDALLNVGGFGKVKVSQYGEEVLEIVREYCEDYNLIPNELFKRSKPAKENKTPTVDETISLFRLGKNMEEIANVRTLAISTIEGHMAVAVRKKAIKIDEVIPIEEAKKIAKLFPENLEAVSLNFVKEKAPGVSFGKLRMVLAWLQLEKETQ